VLDVVDGACVPDREEEASVGDCTVADDTGTDAVVKMGTDAGTSLADVTWMMAIDVKVEPGIDEETAGTIDVASLEYKEVGSDSTIVGDVAIVVLTSPCTTMTEVVGVARGNTIGTLAAFSMLKL